MRRFASWSTTGVVIGLCILLCISFTSTFLIVRKLIANAQSGSSKVVFSPQLKDGYELALINSDNRLVLADIDGGATKTIDLHPTGYAWNPEMTRLAIVSGASDRVWLVNADDGKARVLVELSSVVAHTLSWSPSGRYLAFWGSVGDRHELQIYDQYSDTLTPIPGTDNYDCDFAPPAWSYDDHWIVFTASVCEAGDFQNSSTRHIVTITKEGVIGGTLANMSYTQVSPSPAGHKFAFSSYNDTSRSFELYISDFDSPKASLLLIADLVGGRQLWQPRWLPDGSALYATPLDRQYPEIDLIDVMTGKIQVLWTEVGGAWSPDNARIAAVDDSIRVFDLAREKFEDWSVSTSNICGLHWDKQSELSVAIECVYFGNLPAFDAVVIKKNGSRVVLGDDLYVSILWSDFTVPAVRSGGAFTQHEIIQPATDTSLCKGQSAPVFNGLEGASEDLPDWFVYDREQQGIFALSVANQNERLLTSRFLEAYIPAVDPSPWSPDKTMLAFIGTLSTSRGLFVVKLNPFQIVKLFSVPANHNFRHLDWSPDSTMVAVALTEWDLGFLYVLDIDNMSAREIAAEYESVYDASWAPEWIGSNKTRHEKVLVVIGHKEETYDILLYNVKGDTLSVIARSEQSIKNLEWSPAGRILSYTTCDDSQRDETCFLHFIDINTGKTFSHQVGAHVSSISWDPLGAKLAVVIERNAGSYLNFLVPPAYFTSSSIGHMKELAGPIKGTISEIRWSPDGRRLAFVVSTTLSDPPMGWSDFRSDVYTYDLDHRRLMNITCSFIDVWANGVSWAPEGKIIAFNDGYGVTVMAHDGSGGERVTNGRGSPHWYPETTSFEQAVADLPAVSFSEGPIVELPSPRPTPTSLFSSPPGIYDVLVAYVTHGGYETWVTDMMTGKTTPVQLEDPEKYCCSHTLIGWSPSGDHLALVVWNMNAGSESFLLASHPELIARPVGVLPDYITSKWSSNWSPDGQLIAFTGGDPGSSVVRGIYAFDIKSGNLNLLADLSNHSSSPVTWSPDSMRVVFDAEHPSDYRLHYIYIANADGTGYMQLTNDPNDSHPAWAPGSEEIIFTRGEGWLKTLYVMKSDGSDQAPYEGGSLFIYMGGLRGDNAKWSHNGTLFAYKHSFGSRSGGVLDEINVIQFESGISHTLQVPGSAEDYRLRSFEWVIGSDIILSRWGDGDLWLTDSLSGESYFIASDVSFYSGISALK